MKLNMSKIKTTDDINFGDIVVVKHKGMGVEPFLIAKLKEGVAGIALTGDDLLLGGHYFNLQSFIEDLRKEPLIEKISVFPYTEYMLTLERVK